MKIAMVSPYDFTWPGGVTAHVTQLSRELTRVGHDVRVLAPYSPSREREDAENFVHLGRSVPLPSGGSIARVSLSWWLYPKVRDLLREEDFDIVHLHEPLAPILPLCVLEFSQAVNIGTFHASYQRQHLYRMSHPIIKRWYQRLHGGIAVSPAARRYVSSVFPGDYKIIPNGIDVDRFAPHPVNGPAPWPQYQDGKTNILFVGRLERRKGLKHLLEAYARIKWDRPDTRLLVVGPGNPDRDSQQILSSRALQDVVFAGRVSDEDLPRYYATADICCSPATGSESFGYVLLEAMASSKPVIASNIDGYNAIIEHGRQGLLFHRKDSEALAASLVRLIDDPELANSMGARGREDVEQYRWERVAGQVEDFYLTCSGLATGNVSPLRGGGQD